MYYSEEYNQRLAEAFQHFIKGKAFDYSLVRPVVLESWTRSRNYGVNPDVKRGALLDRDELTMRINSNIDLLEIVHPYIQTLYSVVENSASYIMFCDRDGYILDLTGDPDMIAHGKANSNLVVGALRSENFAGTNAIGTCLAIHEPIQLFGEEHYVRLHKNYSCSCAPIYDPNRNLLGCLNITCKVADTNPHTLGMVLSAADGIMKELEIKKAYNSLKTISAQRNSIIESMNSGIFLLNSSHRVVQVNSKALAMFDLAYEQLIGKGIFSFININDSANLAENISQISTETYNQEISLRFIDKKDHPPKTYNMSANFIIDDSGEKTGTVLRFNETKLINALANKISGYKSVYTFDSIIGNSPPLKKAINDSKQAAKGTSNVLILGESGTGKELIAQAIHNASNYAKGPFVAINCAAIPNSLVESELFGYEPGAFTGAQRKGNPGKFELADGGTIFLDEIGDMPLDVQAAVLRTIQTKEIIRVGGKYPKPIDVRIIAATNKDLLLAMKNRSFRDDLYYRLNVFTIELPALKERGDDICLMADYFVTLHNSSSRNITISPEVYALFKHYEWPGNIRELENIIDRAVNITTKNQITLDDLPLSLQQNNALQTPGLSIHPAPHSPSSENFVERPASLTGEDRRKMLLVNALQNCKGNVSEAAERLGVNRRTLYRRMEKYGIDSNDFRL
jgi:PAS domain S-box-containing protein